MGNKIKTVDFLVCGPAQPTWLEVMDIMKASFQESLKKPLRSNQVYRITLEVVNARTPKKAPK